MSNTIVMKFLGDVLPTVVRVPSDMSWFPSPVTTTIFLSGLTRASPNPIAVGKPMEPNT